MVFGQRPNGLFQLDELNRTLLITGIAATLLGMFFPYGSAWRIVFTAVSTAALVFAAVRILGGHPERRNQENIKFLTFTTGLGTFWRNLSESLRRPFEKKNVNSTTVHERKAKNARKNPTWAELKQYKYFICPQCAQRLRVPRGKGRLRVTCTRCGNAFEIKS